LITNFKKVISTFATGINEAVCEKRAGESASVTPVLLRRPLSAQ